VADGLSQEPEADAESFACDFRFHMENFISGGKSFRFADDSDCGAGTSEVR
jgi:hypothetical protein